MPSPDGQGEYHVASVDGNMVAGMLDMTGLPGMDQMPAHWFTYLGVDDVDAAVEATVAAGGKVQRPPWDIPTVGRIAVVEDSGGASFGLMTPSDD